MCLREVRILVLEAVARKSPSETNSKHTTMDSGRLATRHKSKGAALFAVDKFAMSVAKDCTRSLPKTRRSVNETRLRLRAVQSHNESTNLTRRTDVHLGENCCSETTAEFYPTTTQRVPWAGWFRLQVVSL